MFVYVCLRRGGSGGGSNGESRERERSKVK